MQKTLEYKIDEVTIKISNMKLYISTKARPTPRHKFRLSIIDHYEDKVIFKEDIVISGYSEDFQTKGGAESCILWVLKRINTNLIPQSEDDREKFNKFIGEFKTKLTIMFDEKLHPLCQLFWLSNFIYSFQDRPLRYGRSFLF